MPYKGSKLFFIPTFHQTLTKSQETILSLLLGQVQEVGERQQHDPPPVSAGLYAGAGATQPRSGRLSFRLQS